MPLVAPHSTAHSRPRAPLQWPDQAEMARRIAEVANLAISGKIDCIATVTLAANSSTTTFSDPRLTSTSCLLFTPLSVNAAAAAPWVSGQSEGIATLNHSSNAQTDRTYRVAIIG